ncbi:MAG: hypothetical protein CVV21_01795 [Candidatus Goldiibacteriota bacterium HGW-Goldbacteria-1]|jgi:flagellar hook assembly protein FlgD|nr:MAG: hypothetical protein CVV21_01795 [Candidatus Goldiibacteriota bacterium HGW-Goldbacteria-1]
MKLHKFKAFILSLIFLSISISAFAASALLIVAPGESFTPGSAKTGAPLPQTCGVPFNVNVYAVNDVGWQLIDAAGAGLDLSASAAASFSPDPTTINSTRTVSATINTAATGAVGLYVNNSIAPISGLSPASVTVTAQYIQSFSFVNIASATAGTPIQLTITAIDNTGAQVTSFNGTAALTAVYPNSGDNVSLGTVTFTGGKYIGLATLYNAESGNVLIRCVSTTPSRSNDSNNFAVNPGAFARMLVVGPGQTYYPGTNGGNGRVSSSTFTTTQTAGTPFNVNVYAVDNYWNTVPSAAGTATLDSTDTNDSYDSATKSLASGMASFSVTLRTVGAGKAQTITASSSEGGITEGTDIAPMTYSATATQFVFPTTINTQTAATPFITSVVAMDAYGNTVLNYSGTTTLYVLTGGFPVSTNNWTKTPTNLTFTNGIAAFGVTIFQKLFNAQLSIMDAGVATGISNYFTVNAGNFNRMLIVAPGETYDPGNRLAVTRGKIGTPLTATAGTSLTLTIYATDAYGNKITSVNDLSQIVSSDTLATIGGGYMPQYVTLTAGEASFNMILRTGGSQTITGTDYDNAAITASTVTIPVLATDVSYFSVSGLSGNYVAGVTTTATIVARDQFGNIKTDWAGIIYLSSPNTDYSLPYESTMSVPSSDNSTGAFGHKWAVTFTAANMGQRTLNVAFYRAVTYTARLFVSTDYDDTPVSYMGSTGTSQAISILPNNGVKLQVLPPGMEARPGTVDGEYNTPTGQLRAEDFSDVVRVHYVDMWWNIVNSVQGVNLNTSDPSNSYIDDVRPTTQNPIHKFTNNGVATFTVRHDNNTTTLYLKATHDDTTIGMDNSPNITVFQIYNFLIYTPTGGAIGDQVAGEPFSISIVAKAGSGSTDYADSFNGQIQLKAGNNYSDNQFCIDKTLSDPFVNGICVMNVTLYRASTTIEGGPGGGTFIRPIFGTVGVDGSSDSNKFSVWPGTATRVMTLVDGMTYHPGVSPIVGLQGYEGYEGATRIVEAGQSFDFKVYLVDNYYNIRRVAPNVAVTLTSSDPLASVPEGTMPETINLVEGMYEKTAILRTVSSGAGTQTISVDHPSAGITDNTTPLIRVKHTNLDHFTVDAPSGSVIAGVPFNITIVARDEFANMCDERNEGIPFNNTVDLTAVNGALNTMYPQSYPLSSGFAVANVRMFKAQSTESINASYGSVTTTPLPVVQILPNVFERLLVMSTGMATNAGYFEEEPPTTFNMYLGAPSARIVNDNPSHPAQSFQVYTCDAYGNMTMTADAIGHTITVTTNDPHAPAIASAWISPDSYVTNVYPEFHTAMSGVTVGAKITREGIQDFETPAFTTTAGDFYGFQVLVPGVYVDAGAGTIVSGAWDNAIRGFEYNQLVGSYFDITISAADIYGNFKPGVAHNVRITSSDANVNAYPGTVNAIIMQTVDGIANTTGALFTLGDRQLYAYDLDYPALYNPVLFEHTSVLVTNSGNLNYQIITNGVEDINGLQSVAASAYPATFSLIINVVDPSSNTPVPVGGSNESFVLTPVNIDPPYTPITGTTLYPTSGIAANGRFSVQAHYTRAGQFRIRAVDPNGVLATKYSCIIDMGANTSNVTLTLEADPSNIRANTQSNIVASLVDGNGNPVSGMPVNFTVLSGNSQFAGLVTATAVTGTDGRAISVITGAYMNEENIIEAQYNTITTTASLFTSMSDPVIGEVSNYPNPFRAGTESTNIDYLLNETTDVKIKIYTLFGDLVLTKEFRSGEPGAIAGRMNTFAWDGKNQKGDIVGNGGYICIVEAVIDGKREKMVRKIGVAK